MRKKYFLAAIQLYLTGPPGLQRFRGRYYLRAKNERRQFIFAAVIRKFPLEVGQVAIKFVHFYAHVSSIFAS